MSCPNGNHIAMYDDQSTYFEGLIRWKASCQCTPAVVDYHHVTLFGPTEDL